VSASSTSIANPFEPAGDFAAQVQSLDAARLTEITAWADGLARHPQGGEWRKRGEKLRAEGKAGPVAEFAYASLLAAQGERDEAARLLVDLCEKASGAHAWGTVVEIARRALALDAGAPAARWLVKAVDETGDDEARFLALVEAHEGAPAEARLGWRLSRLYESRGLHEAALEATEASLEALARRHDAAGMEEVLLFLLDDPQPDYLRLTLPPLPLFAKGGEAERVASFLELAWPALASTGLAPETWKMARALLLEVPGAAVINPLVPEIVATALPHLADVGSLLEEAGFPKEPASEWVPRFEKLLPFAPGAYAEHGTMGVGRVTSLTREEVWIDFPSKSGHRMTLRAAHQALTPVEAEDLAVLASWEPKRVAELRTSDPVDLIVRALHRLRGSATTTDLKKVLVRYAVPEKEWTAFWNSAKGRLAKDPRIDASHAFQQRYALGTGTAAEAADAEEAPGAPIPRFDRGADARKVLATLKKFLAQHPAQAGQLARERGGVLRAWRDEPGLEWKERLTALSLLLQGADADAAAGAPAVIAAALDDGFELRELTTAAEQAQMLDLGLVSTAWERAARSGIGSRFTDVRDRAFREVMERHGEAATPFFERVARKAAEGPEAAIAVMERAWKSKGGDAADPVAAAIRAMDPWEAASGLAELLEGGAAEARAKAAVALLDPDGPFVAAARARMPSDDTRRLIERLFLHWRGSDRGLLPFVEWAEGAGLEDVGAAVREKRHLALRKITTFTDTTPLHELPRTFLTRLTYDKLRREAETLDVALRGEIPQAIQKARELGDLRENAEYESAKLKQRTAQARIKQLIEKMKDVSFIEDVPFVADTVGLGTEVSIRVEGDGERHLWILGEGDDHLGSEVVSYKAPLGRALVGKKRGDTVSLPGDGGERLGVIAAVHHRLPEPLA
jgi:transcription elongation factor GreA